MTNYEDQTAEFVALVDNLYESQRDLARDIETTAQTINGYYKGRNEPPVTLMRYLQARKEIARLRDRQGAIDRLAGAFRELLGPSCDQ